MVVGQVEALYRNLSALRVVRSDSLSFILFYTYFIFIFNIYLVRMLICADGMMMATGWAHWGGGKTDRYLKSGSLEVRWKSKAWNCDRSWLICPSAPALFCCTSWHGCWLQSWRRIKSGAESSTFEISPDQLCGLLQCLPYMQHKIWHHCTSLISWVAFHKAGRWLTHFYWRCVVSTSI